MNVTPQPDDSAQSVPSLRIHVFGGLRIFIDDQRISDLPTRKVEALLTYLVVNPYPHEREVLAQLLWDDLSAERTAGNLRLTLNQLRKALNPFIEVTRHTIGLQPQANYWLDLHYCAKIYANPVSSTGELASAIEHYQGDFLNGFYLRDAEGFGTWQLQQAEYWRQQTFVALRRLIERYSLVNNYNEAIRWLHRLVTLDECDEVAQRQLMVLLMRTGQRHTALRQYRLLEQVLEREYGLTPEPASQALQRQILATPAQRPQRLIRATPLLYGRQTELERLTHWLAAEQHQLLTIMGAGGSGKTQLALTFGWKVVNEYIGPSSNGVFYCSLVSPDQQPQLLEAEPVLLTLIQTLSLAPPRNSDFVEHIIRQIQSQELLIIIDNGELLATSARLALSSLLQQIPQLRLIVGSRERMRLQNEYVLELAGLAYPEIELDAAYSPLLAEQFQHFAALDLFMNCLQRQGKSANLADYAPAERQAIGQICQMVHGLPLAIELIAPWMTIRSGNEIVQALSQDMQLFHSDVVDIPTRHRSIQAAFDYSWQLLDQHEQACLARLAVFPSSFDAQAAAAIAAVDMPVLANFHAKSLLMLEVQQQQTRYALHPLLHQFAQSKLQQTILDQHSLYQRHASYFGQLSQQQEPLIHGNASQQALFVLEQELDNLRAGWLWAAQTKQIQILGAYCIALHDFFAIRNREIEGKQLFEPAAALIEHIPVQALHNQAIGLIIVRIVACYAEFQYILGELARSEQLLQQCIDLLERMQLQNANELLFIYKQLGVITQRRGEYTRALDLLQRCLAQAEAINDQLKMSDTWLSIGAVRLAQGNWLAAEQAFLTCSEQYQAQKHGWGLCHSQRFLGVVALAQAKYDQAEHYFAASLDLAYQLKTPLGEALIRDQMGMLSLRREEYQQSAGYLHKAFAIFQELGVEAMIGRAALHIAQLELAQRQLQHVQPWLARAIAIAQQRQEIPLLLECYATVLQLWQEVCAGQPSHWLELWHSLLQHPACSAETKNLLNRLQLQHHAVSHNSHITAELSGIEGYVALCLTEIEQSQKLAV
ncbi:ATP-binding protein [Herpetosiphon llansteffanensis]